MSKKRSTVKPGALIGSSVAGDVEVRAVSAEPRRDLLVNVMHLGRGEWGPRDRYERIRKSSYSVELVVAGSGIMDINGERHELWPGDMVLMHPDDTCIYWTGRHGTWKKLFVSLHAERMQPVVAALQLDNVWHVRLKRADARRARQVLTGMLQCARKGQGDVQREVSVGAYELLVILAGAAQHVRGTLHISAGVQRAIDAVLAPRSAVNSVEAMARVAGSRTAAFSKMFRRQMGLPAHEWLTRARMERAAGLLCGTDKPVHVIAEETGYDDPFHFSRVFRRYTGVSPRTYRLHSRRRG